MNAQICPHCDHYIGPGRWPAHWAQPRYLNRIACKALWLSLFWWAGAWPWQPFPDPFDRANVEIA